MFKKYKIKELGESILDRFELFNNLESVGRMAKYCDYAIVSTFILILWFVYVQIFYANSPPLTYSLSSLLLFLILIIYRGRIHILQKDLELKVLSKDAWKEVKNTALIIVNICLLQAICFCGFYGNNMSMLIIVFVTIFTLLSVIAACVCPKDKSEIYYKTLFAKYKYTNKILNIISKLSDH